MDGRWSEKISELKKIHVNWVLLVVVFLSLTILFLIKRILIYFKKSSMNKLKVLSENK